MAEFVRFFIKTLIGIVLARILSQGDYGTYRQLFLIYTTFSTLLLLGIPQSLLYFLPKADNPNDQRKIITRTVNLITLLALVFALAMILFRAQIALLFNNPALETLLIIYAVYPLFLFITQLYSSVMLGMKTPAKVAVFTIFSVFTDAVIIIGVALFTRSLLYIVVAVIVAALIQWIYAKREIDRYTDGFHIDREGIKEQLRYSIPLGLSSIVGMLTIQLDKIVISGYFSPEQFAIFSIGAMELPFIGILTTSVNSIILPALSSDTKVENAIAIYRGTIRKNALIIFPVCLFCFVFASEIITILYTDLYAASALYFRIYLFTILLRIASYGIIFQAFNQTRVILINSVLVLAANMVLNLWLVKTLGMMGPAIATVAVTYMSVIIYLILIPTLIHIPLKKLFPSLALIKTFSSAIIAALIVYFFARGILNPYLKITVGSTIFGMIYLGIGRLSGAILPYDISFLRSFIQDMLVKVRLSK